MSRTRAWAAAAGLTAVLLALWLWPEARRPEPPAPLAAQPQRQAPRPASLPTPPTTSSSAAEAPSTVPSVRTATRVEPADCLRRCGPRCLPDGSCPPECERDEDCPIDAGCVGYALDVASREVFRCFQQECTGERGDTSCGPGQTCVPIRGSDRRVYMCVQAGLRRSGEPCMPDMEFNPRSLEQACGAGLFCRGTCMPTWCDSDADCPGRCQLMDRGGGECRPGCMHTGACLPWQRCAVGITGVGCIPRSSPRTCIEDGCPPGLHCVPYLPFLAFQVAECRPDCHGTGDCPGGQVCLSFQMPSETIWVCVEPCASDASCGRGLRCQPDPSTGVAVCTLDVGYIDEFFRDYRSPEE